MMIYNCHVNHAELLVDFRSGRAASIKDNRPRSENKSSEIDEIKIAFHDIEYNKETANRRKNFILAQQGFIPRHENEPDEKAAHGECRNWKILIISTRNV